MVGFICKKRVLEVCCWSRFERQLSAEGGEGGSVVDGDRGLLLAGEATSGGASRGTSGSVTTSGSTSLASGGTSSSTTSVTTSGGTSVASVTSVTSVSSLRAGRGGEFTLDRDEDLLLLGGLGLLGGSGLLGLLASEESLIGLLRSGEFLTDDVLGVSDFSNLELVKASDDGGSLGEVLVVGLGVVLLLNRCGGLLVLVSGLSELVGGSLGGGSLLGSISLTGDLGSELGGTLLGTPTLIHLLLRVGVGVKGLSTVVVLSSGSTSGTTSTGTTSSGSSRGTSGGSGSTSASVGSGTLVTSGSSSLTLETGVRVRGGGGVVTTSGLEDVSGSTSRSVVATSAGGTTSRGRSLGAGNLSGSRLGRSGSGLGGGSRGRGLDGRGLRSVLTQEVEGVPRNNGHLAVWWLWW